MAGTLVLCLANGALHHHIGLYLFVIFGAAPFPVPLGTRIIGFDPTEPTCLH